MPIAYLRQMDAGTRVDGGLATAGI